MEAAKSKIKLQSQDDDLEHICNINQKRKYKLLSHIKEADNIAWGKNLDKE